MELIQELTAPMAFTWLFCFSALQVCLWVAFIRRANFVDRRLRNIETDDQRVRLWLADREVDAVCATGFRGAEKRAAAPADQAATLRSVAAAQQVIESSRASLLEMQLRKASTEALQAFVRSGGIAVASSSLELKAALSGLSVGDVQRELDRRRQAAEHMGRAATLSASEMCGE